MRLMMLWISFSVLFSSCAQLERPDTNIWVVNVPAKELKGYNLKRDYDNNGNRKKTAKPMFIKNIDLNTLNKWVCTDSEKGLPNLKAYIRSARQLCE